MTTGFCPLCETSAEKIDDLVHEASKRNLYVTELETRLLVMKDELESARGEVQGYRDGVNVVVDDEG